MSDEAHFNMNGFINKQNCRIWALENPRVIHEYPLHPCWVTVWCGILYGGVIGPYFFEEVAGNSLTVTDESYRDMMQNFVFWNSTTEPAHYVFPAELVIQLGKQ